MKKIISVLLCVVFLFSAFSFSALAAEENTETEKETEFVLEIDVNKRYTDFANEADMVQDESKDGEENKGLDGKTSVYIAILCAALVVSVVILVVSLKKVPKEEDIDISGRNKIKKDKE